ncbi:MAG: Sua5/YciO/YrdC/YwlC family protein [Porticoccaceae bacterium]
MENPITVDWTRHHRIHRAAQAIARGGVVAYPTESVWGLGCDPRDAGAVDEILRLKGRAVAKGLILIAADLDQALPFLGPLAEAERRQLAAPGTRPVTWVVPASPLAPPWITGGRATLALRITRHPLAAALCAVAGTPLVSTSANPQGRPPARNALQVRQYFGDRLADITPGAVGGAAKPSEIRDLRSGEILRPGD